MTPDSLEDLLFLLMTCIALIPARGGSKRIPKKNIRPFNGKPMIAWAIETAEKSGCFSEIVVSTDSEEIAEISQYYGAKVPFMRPTALADDYHGTGAVTVHALEWLSQYQRLPEIICCLYATSPLLHPQDLQTAQTWLKEDETTQFVFAGGRFSFPIQRALRQCGDHRVEAVDPVAIEMRSQDLEPHFHDAGQFYFGRSQAFLQGLPMFSQQSRLLELPSYRIQDIDTPDDWQRAEVLHHLLARIPS